jgi:hypothetical protein
MFCQIQPDILSRIIKDGGHCWIGLQYLVAQ